MVNDVLAIVVMGRLELHRHYMVLLRHILPVSNNPSRACFLPSPLNSALVYEGERMLTPHLWMCQLYGN